MNGQEFQELIVDRVLKNGCRDKLYALTQILNEILHENKNAQEYWFNLSRRDKIYALIQILDEILHENENDKHGELDG